MSDPNIKVDDQQKAMMLAYLTSQQQLKSDIDIKVSNSFRNGTINIRKGIAVAAQTGDLRGNGAMMTLVTMQKPQITASANPNPVQKSVFVSLAQLERLLAAKPAAPASDYINEDSVLAQAKDLFFRFHYKQAGEMLVSILRANRFYYPAWLWQSRIITRQDYIGKALNEAHKWGNHDQDIWREARKIRPQLNDTTATVKRCFLCWSLLKAAESHCSYCNSSLTVIRQQSTGQLKTDAVKFATSMYENAYQQDPKNSRVAYSLAIGYFNLQQPERALHYMQAAVESAPAVVLYKKSLALLASAAQSATSSVRQSPQIPGDTPSAQARRLPAAPKHTASTSREAVSVVSSAATSNSVSKDSGEKKSIMVIEDSPTSRKVLSMVLKRNGYNIFEATTGAEAILLAREITPDLVMLDVMLPDMTGYDVLPELKKIPQFKDLPVVMLTGKKGSTDRMKGILAGTNEYLTKPFNPEKLISVIRGYI